MKTINWNKYSYTEEELREAVKTSFSRRATLLKLGLAGEGAGYKTIIRLISVLNLDTSHWHGMGHLKGKTHSYIPPRPLIEVLKENMPFQSFKLKQRLVKEGLLEDKCSLCEITHWQGQKLSLHLDHINGTHDDNRLENLRLLCPNCHSLTNTYTGKNKKKKSLTNKAKLFGQNSGNYPKTKKICIDCNKEIFRWKSERCRSCAGKIRH
jgi:hypothetical protein